MAALAEFKTLASPLGRIQEYQQHPPHPPDLNQKLPFAHHDTCYTSARLLLCFQLVMSVFSIARRIIIHYIFIHIY